MNRPSRIPHQAQQAVLALLFSAAWLAPCRLDAQRRPPSVNGDVDSVTVQASTRYGAGELHRLMLGDGYRDLWGRKIRVPVLDLRTFAGGLRPLEEGGGAQTRNLRFAARNGREYVFRPVYKERLELPDEYDNTWVKDVYSDGLSHSHPAAPVVAKTLQRAAGLLNPRPVLVVMPDTPLLEEFRQDFAGKLGTIEEHPGDPDGVPGFAGAVEIIDSDDLLEKLNEDPGTRVDARAYLAARLVDFLMGDNDRHRDQWKWARLSADEDGPWVPIPRDRDKAFVSHDGLLLKLARLVKPSLVKFEGTYPRLAALSGKVVEIDRRLLADLELAEWDSVARRLQGALTDAVIDSALRTMPREYQDAAPGLAASLKLRRDQIPAAATRYYGILFAVADVHGTDADDRATITRADEGVVEVELRSGRGTSYLRRRFDVRQTREIRLYLHGGDDRAVVRGNVGHSIPVRVIGGNGTNAFADSSRVAGRANTTMFYDAGTVSGVSYGPDSTFNRRPWVRLFGEAEPPGRDYGTRIVPTMSVKTGRGLGVAPQIGFKRYQYAFGYFPYATRLEAELGYSTSLNGFELEIEADKRFEMSRRHVRADVLLSQIEVSDFRGFGNDNPGERSDFFRVRQKQYVAYPAFAYAFGPESDVSLGPTVRYVVTDSLADRLISEVRPYGFGRFGQAGLQLKVEHDNRDDSGFPRNGGTVELTASAYPALWSVETPYQEITAVATHHAPLPGGSALAFRVGGKKVFGDFPYFDAAFLGGSSSLRTVRRQRFAGDASMYGSVELRVPLGKVGFVLPWNAGLLGFLDVGRVYMDGRSPGGWHSGAGAGFWLGVVSPETSVTVTFTNSRDRRLLLGLGVDY